MEDPAEVIRRLERELEEARARIAAYRGVADNTSDNVMRYDRSGRHLYANPAALAVTGLEWDQFVGKTHAEMGYPEHLCRLWENAIERVYDSGEAMALEFEVELADGLAFLELKLHPELDEAGRVATVLGVSRDVTERRRSADELRLFGEIVANMSEGVLLTRAADGVIVFANPKLLETFGRDESEMIGMHIRDLVAREQPGAAEAIDRMTAALADGEPWRGQVPNVRGDGTVFWSQVSASIFEHRDHGRVWVSVQSDITRERAIEEHRRLIARELDHRVKNNLAGIVALMHQTAESSPDLERFIEVFGGRLGAMARVHEMLARKAWSEIDLAELVATTVSQFVVDDARRTGDGPTARVSSSVALPFAMALYEVAMNAAKYGALSHPAGRLDVRWTPAAERGRIRLTWSETGGTPLESDTRGLGMDMVHGLVRYQIGGEAECRPTADGLTWTFEIPAGSRESAA